MMRGLQKGSFLLFGRRALYRALSGLALAAVLAGLPAAARADGDRDARQLIESLADRAVSALTVHEVERAERARRFRTLLDEHFDVDLIGRWVIGRYWNKATPDQQKEYLNLFENLIVFTYVDRFAEYSGERLAVIETTPVTDGDIVVRTEILRPNGNPPVHVDWRVRHKETQLRIIDVIVEGVSMGQTQRSEFASVIRQGGGEVEALLRKLREVR